MSDMTIRELVERVDAWALRKGWRDPAHPATFGDWIALVLYREQVEQPQLVAA